MLHNITNFKENCGFGLIAHLGGVQSHKVVRTAILGLARMQHRGAILSDGKTGDGCGLSLQMPHKFFLSLAKDEKFSLSKNFAVGMIFFPQDNKLCTAFQNIIQEELINETLSIAKWRDVPVDISVLGYIALANLPKIKQVFINVPAGWTNKDVQRRLFITRRRIEKRIDNEHFYICSLSNLVIVYKSLCMAKDLAKFYLDLANLKMQTAICLFHQRFSTNTLPKWKLAQPFRYLAHNGEINTISGNRAWARARSYKFHTPLIPDLQTAFPFVNENGSDSSALDNMLELFVNCGMDLFRAMRLLVPPAWEKNPNMDDDLRAFYDFNSMHMEPWDGPAGIVLTDGRYAACNLDRNGLRPARYVITQDKLITIASEVGIWDYAEDEVLKKGRVGPGQLLVIDTKESKMYTSESIDNELKQRHPYKQWLDKHVKKLIPFEKLPDSYIGSSSFSKEELKIYYKQFIYSFEEIENVIRVLGENGYEAIGSMGDDAPLSAFSSEPRLIYDYFRQYFAQVTNPPIDSLRENHVMSLSTNIGRELSVFYETESMSHRINFLSPILLYSDIKQLVELPQSYYKKEILDATYNPDVEDLKTALINLCDQAQKSVASGTVLLILSDRKIARNKLPIPATLFVGAVQDRLEHAKLRCDANIVVETGSARDPHHFAVLIGLGATAIYPYLVYESLSDMVTSGLIDLNLRKVMMNYRNGINKGLYKIMSKMGISTISSYRCSRLFEIIGLGQDIMKLCFKNMISRIGGLDFDLLDKNLRNLNKIAFQNNKDIPIGGLLKYKPQGEYHAYNPYVVISLQKATKTGNWNDYVKYKNFVNKRPIMSLRDMLEINFEHCNAISIDKVETEQNLYKRFDTAAMSIGALSPEAHESLAIAMNTLGGFSNSGEGGEDPKRYGTLKTSRIKQVASGRFGVTATYLVNADVIQIKIAQGAKPGEGGQLPGDKVTPYIAQLRYSSPNTTLISPPPHHDIYSIEDLAQLIFDLKQINKHALISVKLVSLNGVGTIATGVAKAYADLITISGYDGGTGASPLTSVKYAGSPWELGLAEAQQALVENNLRHKVRLQVDGGLKTGLDVIKAAILGAESFGFGTGPMIALGCKYLRICHLNNCATGVATQDDILRSKHYHGLPNQVINYFKFIVQDVRENLALLGVTKLTDLIGKIDLLKVIADKNDKLNKIILDNILYKPVSLNGYAVYCTDKNEPYDKGILNKFIVDKVKNNLNNNKSINLDLDIKNTDRSVGAGLSGIIANKYGQEGLTNKEINIKFHGTAGQSFGVWLINGINLTLVGDANDYVGKGMSGGKIVIYPNFGVYYKPEDSIIIGNTCIYGATGGYLFVCGKAGERFAVRNSGAIAVVEGIGDNGCEYMTAGVICILGETGINFGAGMTGGIAYIYDKNKDFNKKLNSELVEAIEISNLPMHLEYLRGLIEKHIEFTNSHIAQKIISTWEESKFKFLLIKSKSQDINSLLGHKRTSISELRVVTY